MKFDKSKVYTSVNADEVKVGSLGYFSDSLNGLRYAIDQKYKLRELTEVLDDCNQYRFSGGENDTTWNLFYLVEEPKEEPKEELCTFSELAQWVTQSNGVWCRCSEQFEKTCFTRFDFVEIDWDEVVPDGAYLIRKWSDNEWHKPTREYMGLNDD